MDLYSYYEKHVKWSIDTFGPIENRSLDGVIAHLRKELDEVEEAKEALLEAKEGAPGSFHEMRKQQEARINFTEEVADIIILALELANVAGMPGTELAVALKSKQDKNKSRKWPKIEDQEDGEPIEHIESE